MYKRQGGEDEKEEFHGGSGIEGRCGVAGLRAGVPASLMGNAELEGVGGVEDEGGFGCDVGGAGYGGNDSVFRGGEAAFEDAADDAFLTPDLAGGEFAVGGEAGELGAGAGAAGGAVVFGTGTEDEAAAVV